MGKPQQAGCHLFSVPVNNRADAAGGKGGDAGEGESSIFE